MIALDPAAQVAVARIREKVAALHEELIRHQLVVWTSGNVSARVPGADLFVIKPAGISYAEVSPENLVLCTFDGEVVADTPGWDRMPSDDAAIHGSVYRALPEVGGIVHTHSTFATAWAALAEPVPCMLTSMAKEFGGEIPVVPSGSDWAGIVDALSTQRSRAVLLQNHGLFAVGAGPRDAVRVAVLAEDSARTAHAARLLGEPAGMPQTLVDELYRSATSSRNRTTAGTDPDTA
jgi:L-ribulose-5-phosphate 4-epimerase